MELRHLRACVALADEESFSRAAARLRLAQPALSRQIKALEDEVGLAMFRRLSRGAQLTEPGRAFVARARAILADVETALQATRRVGRGEVGQLRIGFTASASFNPFVTRAIRDYRSQYPGVEVELVEEATASLLALFRARRLDVAFLRPAPGEADHLWSMPVLGEPLVVAMPAGHRHAGRKRIDLRLLAQEDFVLYPRRNGRALFDQIVAMCREAGFSPRVLQIAPQLTSIVNLVATGIGISIVPASIAQVATTGVVYRPLRSTAQARITLVRSPAPEQQPALVFTDLVRKMVAGAR
jgi:DNA-binding transcriptional LysR family regulator